jgi:hypothetical protein
MGFDLSILRRDRLLKYIIGGSAWILLIGLLGSTAYNGMWVDDNSYRNLQYGRQSSLNGQVLAVVVLGLFAFLLILAALLFTIFLPHLKLIEIIIWAVGGLLTFIVVVIQGVTLGATTYSGTMTEDEYNYLDQYSDFKTYVEKYQESKFCLHFSNLSQCEAVPAVEPFDVSLSAFFVDYLAKDGDVYHHQTAASCAFDWAALAAEGKIGDDPCKYDFGDKAAECIGGWTGGKFIDYWCSQWEQYQDDVQWAKDKKRSQADIQKRLASRARIEQVIDSNPALYRHNTYLIGINTAALILSIASVTLDAILSRGGTPGQSKKEKEEPNGAAG